MPPSSEKMSAATFLLLLLLFLTTLLSDAAYTSAAVSESPCKHSFYPKLCRAMLAPAKQPKHPDDYTRFSVKQSLKQAQRITKILDSYLARNPSSDNGALADCRQLSGLNVDYLSQVQDAIRPGRAGMDVARVEKVKALMSAVVTNQQTCYDGLESSRSFGQLNAVVGTGNEMAVYGISLELVASQMDRTPNVEPGSDNSTNGRNLLEGDINTVQINQWVTVALDGSGNFSSINDAVAFAPNGTSVDEDGYFAIYLGPGTFQENVLVAKNKKNIIMIGAGIDRTIITGNRSVIDGWTTYNSATFAVHGERFIATNITIENTAGPSKHQAVALRSSADLSSFYRCKFLGYQDTLYVHSLRQFYRDCDIYSTIDFIFGNAASVFQNCNIYARKPLPYQINAITAQGRVHPNQTTGISIHNCSILADQDLKADMNGTKTYLGRPWKEYSRTVYMQSFIDGLVDPAGWLEWNGTFALDTLFYGEFQNYGAGANVTKRVQWKGYSLMDEVQASNFTVFNFTAGQVWLPHIPHSGGLLEVSV